MIELARIMWFVAAAFSGGTLIYVLTPLWSQDPKVSEPSRRDIEGKVHYRPTEDLRSLEMAKQELVEHYRSQKDRFESGSLAQDEWLAEKQALEKQYQKTLGTQGMLYEASQQKGISVTADNGFAELSSREAYGPRVSGKYEWPTYHDF